jgi:hypothetical protein
MDLLHSLNAETPRSVVFGTELPDYGRLLEKHQNLISRRETLVLRKMRSLVRERITKLRNEKKKKSQKWGFIPEEISLNVLDNELRERIKQVLVTLGMESDFEQLHKRADALVDLSAIRETEKKLEQLFPFSFDSVTIEIQRPIKSETKLSRKNGFSKLKV